MWDTTLRDLRHAARALARSKSFTTLAVMTLALGIGATTAVFSVVDGVLLKPLSYPESDRLAAVWHDAPGAPGLTAVGGLPMSVSMAVAYREQNGSFDSIGAWSIGAANVTGRGEPQQIDRALVTGQALTAFGVQPLLGRWIDERDEPRDRPPVAVLSYGYWQDRFGGDPAVLGQRLEIDSVPTEIVGVMPRGFRFGDAEADVIGAMQFDRSTLVAPPFTSNGVARLKAGVTLEQANADVARMLPIWLEMFPFRGGPQSAAQIYLDTWRMAPALKPLKADVIGNVGDSLWVVLAMIGIVLVIASANVTNLLLVRGQSRARELEVRAALGAASWRIARSMLAETLLLAAVAGVIGVALAYGALQLLLALAPQQLPRLAEIMIDARALAFAFSVTLIAGAAISVAPVLRVGRARLSTSLRAARGTSAGRAQHRAQNALVVGQVALALVLLVSSGLMIRTFEALRAVEPGFAAPESIQTFRVTTPSQPNARDILVEQRAIVDALEAIPGVSSVGLSSVLPMDQVAPASNGIAVEGGNRELEAALRVFDYMSPGYLETMGIRVVAGRDLTWADLEETRFVTLISAGLARELFGSPEAALGRRIRGTQGGAMREIVGVVEDVRSNGLERAPPATVYWPSMMADFFNNVPLFIQRGMAFAVRSPLAGTPGLARQIEQAVWSVNPDLPIAAVQTMRDVENRSLARTSFTLVMLLAAAGAALVLGVVGLYGVLSYVVSTRRREIAIRFALGARTADVQARIVRRGVALCGIGVAIGLVVAAGVTRLMTSLLYGVQTVDPLTYAAVAAGLIAVAAVASYLPARRASTVDPAESLAAE